MLSTAALWVRRWLMIAVSVALCARFVAVDEVRATIAALEETRARIEAMADATSGP